MKSKIFAETETPVQFICTNKTVITLKKYYTLSTSERINNNYIHLYLTQEECDVIELLDIKRIKEYLLYLYAKHTKDYIHSKEISHEDEIVLWYIDDYSTKDFPGYVIVLKDYTVEMFHTENILIYMDIGITKEEFDTINTLYELHPTLAYPTAIEIAKQYQPTLEV